MQSGRGQSPTVKVRKFNAPPLGFDRQCLSNTTPANYLVALIDQFDLEAFDT